MSRINGLRRTILTGLRASNVGAAIKSFTPQNQISNIQSNNIARYNVQNTGIQLDGFHTVL